MDSRKPRGEDVDQVVQTVGICDAVERRIAGNAEEKEGGHVSHPIEERMMLVTLLRYRMARKEGEGTYQWFILGIMFPVVSVSTSNMNGMIDSRLWWDENGVSQCTARL